MTTLLSIVPAIRDRIGDTDPQHYEWSDSRLVDLIHRTTTQAHNFGRVLNQIDVIGSGLGKTFSPAPTNHQLHLITLYVARAAVASDEAKYARLAVKITSPLGTRDLKDINKDLKRTKKDLDTEISEALNSEWHDDMIDNGVKAVELTTDTTTTTAET